MSSIPDSLQGLRLRDAQSRRVGKPAMRLRVATMLALSLFLCGTRPVAAQGAAASFPDKPIHIVVAYPPGGASDVIARMLAQKLDQAWGQPVIVENRAGANGNIGGAYVAKSKPDGYTLLLIDQGSLTISPSIMPMSYSPTKDLTPVAMAGYSPHILVVSNKLPVKTLDELIQYSKANKGKVSFGETPGAITHLAGVLIAQKKGLDWNYIGYKGGAQVIADLAAGQIDVAMNSFLATYPLVKGGRIRMLAVASPKRFGPIPDTPTIAETIPGFVTGSYQGILAPAGTPKDVVAKLYDEVTKIVAMPDIRRQLSDAGTEPVSMTPAEFAAWLEQQTAFWGKVVKDGNIKVE